MKTIQIVYNSLKESEGQLASETMRENKIKPGSYYSAITRLIEKGLIDEDLQILKEYDKKTPFYGFTTINSKYPRYYVNGTDFDLITRIKGKFNDLPTGTNIGIKRTFSVENEKFYLLKDNKYKVKQLFIKGLDIEYYKYGVGMQKITEEQIIGEVFKI